MTSCEREHRTSGCIQDIPHGGVDSLSIDPQTRHPIQ
jgi:hypothetical protein